MGHWERKFLPANDAIYNGQTCIRSCWGGPEELTGRSRELVFKEWAAEL